MPDDADDLSRLADQLLLGLLRVAPDLTVVDANHAAHLLLARPPGRLIGGSVMAAFLDHRVEEAIAACLDGGSRQMELDGPGERRVIVRSRRATTGGVLVVLEDVTELRRLQRIRSEFIDNLSHELRTPLTTIRLLTERVLDELDSMDVPPRLRERVATIDVETGHLVQMVNELLDLSRIEQATTQLHLEDVALGPLAEAGIARMRTFAERQGVLLVSEVPAGADLPEIRGDADRLGQVLVNLLHNALKFSPPGRRVIVRAEASAPEVVLSVIDEGPGVSRGDQSRIFERFYKVDRARPRAGGGTGLGLSIARHIVEAHGGRIWVESDEGHGASFRVALPIAP
jgi:two-component system, OmpR family, phosphate regulon sensor histidine kinase PhoR